MAFERQSLGLLQVYPKAKASRFPPGVRLVK